MLDLLVVCVVFMRRFRQVSKSPQCIAVHKTIVHLRHAQHNCVCYGCRNKYNNKHVIEVFPTPKTRLDQRRTELLFPVYAQCCVVRQSTILKTKYQGFGRITGQTLPTYQTSSTMQNPMLKTSSLLVVLFYPGLWLVKLSIYY